MAENKLAKFYASLKVGDYVWVISLFAKQKYKHKNENLPVLVKTKIQDKLGFYKFCFGLKLDKIYPGTSYNLNDCFTDEKLARKRYVNVLGDYKDLVERDLDLINKTINKQTKVLSK